ncbi:MAG: aspartate/glutamate racemase family protein [Hyphomicrobiales bacterium]|nr:aspartate/glutamate racemase family protein [Hyphomicrobiales bacterium]
MSNSKTIGLVVPHADDTIPAEGLQMYPSQRFVAKGVGVRSLTPEGYAAAFDAIMPAAEHLMKQRVDAIMVIGTSLTFYRGPEAHNRLLEKLRSNTGLPVSTMSQAILDGLAAVGAQRLAVTTAYTDVVNRRLRELLQAGGYEVLSLEAFHILEFGGPARMSEADIMELSGRSVAKAPGADAVVISCGGLRTLGVHQPLEEKHGLPVVSSTPAAFWAAMRLIGESGYVGGHGRLLEGTAVPVH